MAIYRLSMKVGSRGSGKAHYDYITGDGKYKRTGIEDDIAYTQSINMPSWARSERDFWKEEEKKKDGFRKIELALPVECTLDEQKQLLDKFISEELSEYACSYALHTSKDGSNPHAHIMFSERKITNDREEPNRENYFKRGGKRKDGTRTGGYAKDRLLTGANRKQRLIEMRENWANIQNRVLMLKGKAVSHESYAERGIDQLPQIHIGSAGKRMKERSDRYQVNERIKESNKLKQKIKGLTMEVRSIVPEINNIVADYKQNKQEIEQLAKQIAELEQQQANEFIAEQQRIADEQARRAMKERKRQDQEKALEELVTTYDEDKFIHAYTLKLLLEHEIHSNSDAQEPYIVAKYASDFIEGKRRESVGDDRVELLKLKGEQRSKDLLDKNKAASYFERHYPYSLRVYKNQTKHENKVKRKINVNLTRSSDTKQHSR